ncbi:MAG: glycosyltransferase family 2 protein [Candidatus Andersenbacteria bacterium]|nr:glycosyltransferase family 2 protein [Candidatus Andersenbacteria bacterium]MBI3250447.1 glycosyltransferase family 2 protein [Candidatus Andersenbacteria bacterium]
MIAIEFDIVSLRRRLWQILPGALSWGTLISLTLLSFFVPYWIAIFVIAYDVYVLVRIVYMSTHLIYAYRQLKAHRTINWMEKLQQLPKAEMGWDDIHHYIVVPTYNESLEVLHSTLSSLKASTFPAENLHVVVGFEERAGTDAQERAQALTMEFGSYFRTFLTTFHPDGLPNEKRVKSANACWAIKKLEEKTKDLNIPVPHVLVSNLDSDTVLPSQYFAYLTHVFLEQEDKYQASYQPIPVYNNNLWDAPSFSRVIAMGSTFWQMIESTRPERLVTFSSHSMTLLALQEVGYWQRDIISEDSRIFWQALLHYAGNYRAQPLYITVSMDAALADSWWKTLKNQYRQKRRWAWGIENFPYIMEGFLRNREIPFDRKFPYLFRTLEGHFSWATAPIIVAGLGWLPIIFGSPEFHATFLSYSLPFVARTLMSIAMSGLVISAALTLLLSPPRPAHYTWWRHIQFVLQWILVPIISMILSAFPALDAETRLLLGRDLHFNVMQKSRKKVHVAT